MRPADITAIVLCGGSGTRLGGVEKPLLRVGRARVIDHLLAALSPQVGTILLSCGRDTTAYEDLGLLSIPDLRPGDGPLGGIVSALPYVETDWILSHPGDVPFPDTSLVARLAPVAEVGGIAVPKTRGIRQNLTLLISRAKAAELARFYEQGGRAARDWLDATGADGVDMSDLAESFLNINTAADVRSATQRSSEYAEPMALDRQRSPGH